MSEVERKNQQWNPKYLHALVPVEEAEEGKDEDGVLNGVKKLLKEERKMHEERMKKMEQTIEQMNANQKQMEEKINSQLMTILQAVRPQK